MTYKNDADFAAAIRRYEQNVRKAQFSETLIEFRTLFASIESGARSLGAANSANADSAEQEATRFAAAITCHLTHPDFSLTRDWFAVFCAYKRAISQLFEISGYRGTAHFVELFSSKNENGDLVFRKIDVPKMFCGMSLNAMSKPLLDLLMRQQLEISWPIANAFLSEQILWSDGAEEVRSQLLASSDHWMDLVPTKSFIHNLGQSYMGCSYADAPHKHQIKKLMNKMARTWLAENGVTGVDTSGLRQSKKKRPKIVIIAELYDSTHAMHRVYGPAIRGLKENFELIFMSPLNPCDPKIKYMFDVVDNTGFDPHNPKIFFDKVKSHRPNIVYYTSIGMRLVSLLGSNLRLAPVQIMTYGHPGTTMSDCIDYGVVVDGQLGSEDTLNEQVLYWPALARYEKRADAKKVNLKINKKPRVVRIAVPAFTRKITPQFLRTCVEIEKRASRKVQFIFFPNSVGPLFQGFKRRVESMMNAQVLPRKGYNAYIEDLNRCDIFLSTFPFGATNGILDASRQGFPIVNLKGGELHAYNDSEMVAQIGQPSWLSVTTVEEFIAATLRLIENDEERVAISEANAAYDFDANMMVAPGEGCPEFGTAFKAAYKYHEKFQENKNQSWSYDNLVKLLEN